MPGVKKNAMKSNTQEISLVPEKDQPYPLPEGWKWVRLGSITQIVGGGTPPSKVKEYYEGGDIPWLSPVDLSNYTDVYISRGKKMITANGLANSSARMMPAETVCLSSRAPIGYVAIAKNPLCTNQGFKSFLPSPFYRPRFLYWYLKGNKPLLESYASGTTFLELSGTKAAQIEFPLPPLEEQERIVTRIESLFAKLDEAKEKAEAVLDTFENRKAAILHKAFTGELTAKWREERGIEKERWENVTVGEICHDVKVGIVIKPSQYYTDQNQGTPAFRSANVRENHIGNFDCVYINNEGMTTNKRCIVHTGDVLVVRSGNLGTACVVPEEFDGYNAIDILIAVPDQSKVMSQYLCSFTNSPLGKKSVAAGKRGMALAHFNVKGYSALPLELPTIAEQQEITRLLDSLLEKEQKSKEAAESVLEQIDLMKKAILAKAFRGELGN